jgi:hypothetical protein
MYQCIYCDHQFDDAPKEHIIHAFLGARWSDGTIICKGCQDAFANGIDARMAEQLQPFRLLLGTKGDHGGTGLPIGNLKATSGETLSFGAHGKPRLARPYVEITDDSHIRMKLRREADLGWAMNMVREQFPDKELDQEAIRKLGVEKKERVEGAVTIDLAVGGLEFFQAVLKCCVNLFAAHASSSRATVSDTIFDAVRTFVRDGTGQMSDFARWIGSPEPLDLPNRGPADHTIMLTTRDENVEGVVRFFGQLPFAVRLATQYSGSAIRCAYVVDPYREADPAEVRLNDCELEQYDEQIPVFAEQSSSFTPTAQSAWSASVHRFMDHYVERENEEIVGQVVDEAIAKEPTFAKMPRSELEQIVRELMKKRFDNFEQTGDAKCITVLGTQAGSGSSPSG